MHLGTRNSQSALLREFLQHHSADYLYLVGDIIDGWALSRSWFWEAEQNEVVQEVLRWAQESRVIYVPGNHDEFARAYAGLDFGGVKVRRQTLHTLADSRQLLVLHGDEFDGVVRYARWLSLLGMWTYHGLLQLNRWYNLFRRGLKLPYWSLASYLKTRTKRAVQFIADFEHAVARQAAEYEVDGVICGHIHCPELRTIDSITYANTGDWVEHCTALVEHVDGRLELIQWAGSVHKATSTGGDGEIAAVPPPTIVSRSKKHCSLRKRDTRRSDTGQGANAGI